MIEGISATSFRVPVGTRSGTPIPTLSSVAFGFFQLPDNAKRVDLSGDKRTRVQTAFKGAGDVKHRTNVNIHIAVGTRLPRDWDFVPVPIAVVALVPECRDYVFVYVDDQYVICDPDTYEVVAVLPAERGYAGSSGGGNNSLSRSDTEIWPE